MKKSVLLSLLVLFAFSCSSDDGDGSGTDGTAPFVIMGNTSQATVSYNTDITSIDFEMTTQTGDSTFYEANLDVDGNNSTDIRFQVVSWTDNVVLSVRSTGYAITASQDSFELIGSDVSLESLVLFPAGIEINGSITGFTTATELFLGHFLNGQLTTSSQSVWSDVAYLPFTSATRTGWVGLNVVANGTDIQSMGINTIAIR
ncbi:hypothetical protein [Roseivirga misakiensis]|uniref:Uncharacterized protein n=1 Tax=Roseivirga misakiensis TaxID=1563681 RepID=A0A1E5SYL7_9BACT|nr:hypothetical protein [Roseivirga misakiensis]OEK04205.1 hypothetical protein BFP71_12025 [Roseivirga misakiensis]